MPAQSAPLTDNICATPGCGKKVCARGFCISCYYKRLRYGDFETGSQTKKWKHRLSSIDVDNRTAICLHCGPVKIISRGNGQWRCSTDVNSRSRDYKRAYRASKKAQMVDCCEICGDQENLRWDHDHITGDFRGTLCNRCNFAIGLLKDNPDFCIKASEYLRKGKKTNEE